MAIITMTNKDRANQPNVFIGQYPGWDEAKHGPLYMEKNYEGCVLEKRELNGYDDSDFYAIVWDEPSQSIKRVEYATTRAWTYPNSAVVDATPEVLAKAEKFLADCYFETFKKHNVRDAQTPASGKTVKVIKGRKVPIGKTGRCIGHIREWKKQSFGRTIASQKSILVQWSDMSGDAINIQNLEVQNPDQFLQPEEELRSRADELAKHHSWSDALALTPGYLFVP